MLTWSDVTAMFPADAALAAIPLAAQTAILARVGALSSSYFGDRYQLAQIYLAAHLGVVGGLGGHVAAGPVTAESEGGVARQYAVIGLNQYGSRSSTGYGQLFDELVRSSPGRIGLTS